MLGEFKVECFVVVVFFAVSQLLIKNSKWIKAYIQYTLIHTHSYFFIHTRLKKSPKEVHHTPPFKDSSSHPLFMVMHVIDYLSTP